MQVSLRSPSPRGRRRRGRARRRLRQQGPDVRADYDQSVDFGKYRTYGFVAQAATDTAEFKSLAHADPADRGGARNGSARLHSLRHSRPRYQFQGQARGEDGHRVDACPVLRSGLWLSRLVRRAVRRNGRHRGDDASLQGRHAGHGHHRPREAAGRVPGRLRRRRFEEDARESRGDAERARSPQCSRSTPSSRASLRRSCCRRPRSRTESPGLASPGSVGPAKGRRFFLSPGTRSTPRGPGNWRHPSCCCNARRRCIGGADSADDIGTSN